LNRAGLAELADSIRAQGILQPLLVRPAVDGAGGEYEIIAGERRWQAARMAGMQSVPVIVRHASDRDALAMALIENLQREDLNAVDQAIAIKRLTEEFELTHKAVAEAVGRSRSTVTNLLRLLELHPEVQAMLARGELEMGHARALLALDLARQARVGRRAAARNLSVREVERLVQRIRARAAAGSTAQRPSADMDTRWFQELLTRELGREVTIRIQKDGRRRLGIDFDSLAQLEQHLERIEDVVSRLQKTAGPRARSQKESVDAEA
jgi:ParB family chromosome partitioning protein